MIKYIVKDMVSALRYLPYGLVAGIVVAILINGLNRTRTVRGKKPFSVASLTAFFMYAVIILFITFWSREEGSRSERLDLTLFSTWGINDRNNAFVVENILLFVPYGFVLAWAAARARKLLTCTLLGFLTSLGIECMQLVSGRGFFELDDIVTNVIGTVVGYILFRCFWKSETKNGEKARLFYIVLTALLMIIVSFGVIVSSGESIMDSVLENSLLNRAAHASQYAALAVVFGFGCQTIRQGRGKAVNLFCTMILCLLISIGDFLRIRYILLQPEGIMHIVIDLGGAFVGACIYLALGWLADVSSGSFMR